MIAATSGLRWSSNRWAPVHQSIAGPFFFVSAQEPWLSVPRLTKDVWTSAAYFQDPLAFGLHASGSRSVFELSAVQISGLPGNDRPVTHTVILRLARSWILSRWRHAISSRKWTRRTPRPRALLAA